MLPPSAPGAIALRSEPSPPPPSRAPRPAPARTQRAPPQPSRPPLQGAEAAPFGFEPSRPTSPAPGRPVILKICPADPIFPSLFRATETLNRGGADGQEKPSNPHPRHQHPHRRTFLMSSPAPATGPQTRTSPRACQAGRRPSTGSTTARPSPRRSRKRHRRNLLAPSPSTSMASALKSAQRAPGLINPDQSFFGFVIVRQQPPGRHAASSHKTQKAHANIYVLHCFASGKRWRIPATCTTCSLFYRPKVPAS